MKCCSGLERLQRQLLAFRQLRQLMLQGLIFFVLAVLGLLVDFEKSFELQNRTGDAKTVIHAATLRVDIDGGLIEDGRIHLRRDKALPDELVNLELVFLQVLSDGFRMPRGGGWPDGFMRILRVLLGLEEVRCFGQKLRAVLLGNQFTHFSDRVIGNTCGVGTHVGNKTDCTFIAQIDALVQALRDHHGALHAETQLS